MRNLRGVKKEKKKMIVQIVSFWILGLLVREKTEKKLTYYLSCQGYEFRKLRSELKYENPNRRKKNELLKILLSFLFLSKQMESLKILPLLGEVVRILSNKIK